MADYLTPTASHRGLSYPVALRDGTAQQLQVPVWANVPAPAIGGLPNPALFDWVTNLPRAQAAQAVAQQAVAPQAAIIPTTPAVARPQDQMAEQVAMRNAPTVPRAIGHSIAAAANRPPEDTTGTADGMYQTSVQHPLILEATSRGSGPGAPVIRQTAQMAPTVVPLYGVDALDAPDAGRAWGQRAASLFAAGQVPALSVIDGMNMDKILARAGNARSAANKVYMANTMDAIQADPNFRATVAQIMQDEGLPYNLAYQKALTAHAQNRGAYQVANMYEAEKFYPAASQYGQRASVAAAESGTDFDGIRGWDGRRVNLGGVAPLVHQQEDGTTTFDTGLATLNVNDGRLGVGQANTYGNQTAARSQAADVAVANQIQANAQQQAANAFKQAEAVAKTEAQHRKDLHNFYKVQQQLARDPQAAAAHRASGPTGNAQLKTLIQLAEAYKNTDPDRAARYMQMADALLMPSTAVAPTAGQ